MLGMLSRLGLSFSLLGLLALPWAIAGAESDGTGPGKPMPGAMVPRVIFSTDIATGSIDTHGGMSLRPVVFDADHEFTNDSAVTPQDIDDGLTLAMALNLEAAGRLLVLGVVPTYGNASLPAEMRVARRLIRGLKRRQKLAIVPGATGPVSQVLHPTPTLFNGETVAIEGSQGSFAASCRNAGVEFLRERIGASATPVTLLAIGPLTDVACLLTTAPRRVLTNIKEIVLLASRLEGESLTVNGLVVNDFNFRLDPVAGTLLLGAPRAQDVPLRLMAFSLTGQTSQDGAQLIPFNAATYPGPQPPTQEGLASFRWLLRAAQPRNAFWSGIFGSEEGPFDQYTLAAAVAPELFDCQEGRAYVQQCPFPAWSPDYNPAEDPYNADNNACVDHGLGASDVEAPFVSSLATVPAELVVSLDSSENGALVRGTTGIDGNIPNLEQSARRVTVCHDFASDQAFQDFKDLLLEFTW